MSDNSYLLQSFFYDIHAPTLEFPFAFISTYQIRITRHRRTKVSSGRPRPPQYIL